MDAKNTYKIKIENFEGPLDLLLHLIEKNEMDIYAIRINEITDQYMDILYSMSEWDLELSSEFLVMASTLLHIKSKTLLPSKKEQTETGEDPGEDLVNKLIEYRKYKDASKEMLKKEQLWLKALYKKPENINFSYKNEIIELKPEALFEYMQAINERNARKLNDNRDKMQRILEHEKVSLKEKMNEIIIKLKKRTSLVFSEIFHIGKNSKIVVVTGFQAILELSKTKKVNLFQKKPFDEIQITKNKDYFTSDSMEDSNVG